MGTTNVNFTNTQSASGFRKTGAIIIFSFVALLLFVIILDSTFFPIVDTDSNNPSAIASVNSFWTVAYTLLLNIAAAGITTGAGPVLYGHFDFVQYVKNTLCQVILEHDFVDHLNDSEKDALMQKLKST